ncbi:hypothetical protein H0H93_007937 [Arthromyces matolae]|nr:hypothetical protein H0H93_007937 [Arthromyces matolae]
MILNVLKTYQAVARYLDEHPAKRNRFPNFYSSKPILAKGSPGPLQGDLHSAQYFHGRDGLGGISERHPELNLGTTTVAYSQFQLSDRPGPDLALELIRSHPPESVTYIALGPLTNLAHMIRKDGNLFRDKIGRVVCMGGALDVPGNTSPVAEFNFFADPYAVKELLLSQDLHSGLPLDRFLLLPLDITTPHELPFKVYTEAIDPGFHSTSTPSVPLSKCPLIHFTSSFLERTREIMVGFGKDAMELHDIVAVWCAIENPPGCELSTGWKTRSRIFDIERTGELTRGMLVVDRREDESAYSPGANRAQIQAELEKRNIPHGDLESTAVPAQVEAEKDTKGQAVFTSSKMTRGRKKDLTIPPTRALVQQRDYRARRARYVSDLEERVRKAEEENEKLRHELAAARSGHAAAPSSFDSQTAHASSELMHNLSIASASLARFQQLAFSCQQPFERRTSIGMSTSGGAFPQHSSNNNINILRPSSFPSPAPSPPYALPMADSSTSQISHLPPRRKRLYREDSPESVISLGDQDEHSRRSESRASTPLSDCCGGIMDCRELIERVDSGAVKDFDIPPPRTRQRADSPAPDHSSRLDSRRY